MWEASVESGGTAVAKRESYRGGGSKGMEGVGSLASVTGWVAVFRSGNGV